MRLHRTEKRNNADSTIALINIAFLLLVFFLVAGTIVPMQESNVIPPVTEAGRGDVPNDVVFMTTTGEIVYQNRAFTRAGIVEQLNSQFGLGHAKPVKIVADRGLSATELIDFVDALNSGGFPNVRVITVRDGR